MRKAFDANVPKFRPRLKSAMAATELQEAAHAVEPEAGGVEAAGDDVESATASPLPDPLPAARGEGEVTAEVTPSDLASPLRDQEEAAVSDRALSDPPSPPPEERAGAGRGGDAAPPQPSLAFDESPDVQSRRDRLLAVKRKVAAAARPAPPMPALPETAARAGESALALVKDFEAQLTRAREVETALRADLDDARAELARGATEGRRAVERLATVEQQVEEKRAVLEEMLSEMSALEEERDGAVARAQALSALDEERQGLLDAVSTRAEQAEKARGEAEAEVGRLGAELDERAADLARLRAALAQVTRERDDLARDLAEARRERDELSEARRALEQVHEALATARARLG
jgi:signal transduction histidine kinase